MKQLLNLELFSLLKESNKNKIDQSKMEDAYGEFATQLLEKLQSETAKASLYYHLGFIRLELVEIQNILSDEKEKKCFIYYK